MDFIFRAAEKFMKDHKRLMRYRKIFAVLAAVVVFATTYELILPAITIDRQRAAETPGMEVGVAAGETAEMDEAESTDDSGDIDADEENAAEESNETEDLQDESNDAEEAEDSRDADYTEKDSGNAEEDTDSAEDTDGENDGQTDSAQTESSTSKGSDANDDHSVVSADDTAAVSGSDIAAAAADEQLTEYPVTLTYEGDGYTITATFDETANLPVGVSLDALEILPDMVYRDEDGNVLYDDYEVYLEKTVETLEKDGRLEDSYVASARFFDISFIDPEGNYVEPAAPVVIAAQYKKALSAEDTVNTATVRFEAGKDKTEIYETKQDVKNGAIAELSFETKKSSVYGIAAAEALETKELTASGDTYEISLSYNQKAEIPEDAKLEAHELLPGTEEYEECAAKSSNLDENGETSSRFFDISIMADGAEFEPKAPVNVKITLKDIAPENVAADKDITHFTNAGDVENIPQEVEEASDGGAEISFQMESFSTVEVPLLGAGSTPTYTISVGGTKTITGTKSSSSDSWSSSDETIAAVTDSSANTATVTGVKAGTATITHSYYVKKKTATEDFIINVEAASGEITETADARDGDVTVSVKRTGTTKKLEGCTLVVEKLISGADFDEYAQALTDNGGDTDALKGMYHIYLKDNSGNEVSVSNANMEVTITDPALSGLDKVKVGHFKKTGNIVTDKGFADGTFGLKKVTVSERSITFVIKNFSVITVETIDETSSGGSTGVVTSHTAGAYSGQIVYTNTSSQIDYAYESYAANGSGITKTIEPTAEENVFKVTVNLSRKPAIEDLQKWFQQAGGYVLQSNGSLKNESPNNTQGGIGDPYEAQAHDYRFYGTDQGTYSVTVHYTIDNKTFDVVMYAGSNANTGTYHKVIVPLPNGKWLDILCTHFKKDVRFDQTELNNLNINLTNHATELYKAFAVDFNTVTNTIDTSRFEYLGSTMNGINSSNGVSGSVVSAGAPNGSGEMIVSNLGGLSVGSTDSFSYYVRLKADGITPMDSSDTWPTPRTGGEYQEGSLYANVTAHYTTITENIVNGYVDSNGVTVTKQTEVKEFTISKPSVSGELYYIKLLKHEVDADGNVVQNGNGDDVVLSDVTFRVYKNSYDANNPETNLVDTFTTDDSGYGITTKGLPWGTYVLVETVPDGYMAPNNNPVIGTYNLGYLGSGNGTWIHEQIDENKLGKSLTGDSAIGNKRYKITVSKNVEMTGSLPKTEIDQTIYMALWDNEDGDYVRNADGTVLVKAIEIKDGVPTPNSVTFGENEALEGGKTYLVSELVKVSDVQDDLSAHGNIDYVYENNEAVYIYNWSNLTFANSTGDTFSASNISGETWNYNTSDWSNGRSANLENDATEAKVKFTNTYTYEDKLSFVVNKEWGQRAVSGGTYTATRITPPTDATVIFSLYRKAGSAGIPVHVSDITLDGTADSNGETTSSGSSTWQATWTNLPKFDEGGNRYIYMVQEISAPDGFEAFDSETDKKAMEEGDYEYTNGGSIWNIRKSLPVKVYKVDAFDTTHFLADARFTVAATSTGTSTTWTSSNSSPTKGQLFSGELSFDTYTLTETVAPAGYNLLSNAVTITVGTDGPTGPVTYTQTDHGAGLAQTASLLNPEEEASSSNPYVVYIYNTPGVELPETGGTGFLSPQTLCGIMAMAFVLATAVMYGFSMRRGERRFK